MTPEHPSDLAEDGPGLAAKFYRLSLLAVGCARLLLRKGMGHDVHYDAVGEPSAPLDASLSEEEPSATESAYRPGIELSQWFRGRMSFTHRQERARQIYNDALSGSRELRQFESYESSLEAAARDEEQATRVGDSEWRQQIRGWQAEQHAGQDQLGDGVRLAYSQLRARVDLLLSEYPVDEITADEPDAQYLLDIFHEAPTVQPHPSTEAPFAQASSNTPDVWRAVSLDQIGAFLEGRHFVDPELIHETTVPGAIVIERGANGDDFEVPLDMIISLSGFKSWLGRGEGVGKDWSDKGISGSGKSRDAILNYAARPTDLPSVGTIRILIQPNGRLVCDNGSGDSHRIAAAILRGQETIKARRLEFVTAWYNYVD